MAYASPVPPWQSSSLAISFSVKLDFRVSYRADQKLARVDARAANRLTRSSPKPPLVGLFVVRDRRGNFDGPFCCGCHGANPSGTPRPGKRSYLMGSQFQERTSDGKDRRTAGY
jgi:hypothetical protein